jgi:hypothetical protein
MKLFREVGLLCAVLVLLLQVASADSSPKEQPLYISLTADISDHINLDMTEMRLRRILPMLERYRDSHPNENIRATVLFSGAVAEALVERNGQTHILDFVKDFIHRGVIEVGYDGSAEPTYAKRPLVDLRKAHTGEERYQERAIVAEEFLTEARDPLTGKAEPGKDGGLKRMQEVFGQADYIAGLTLYGADPMVKTIPELGTDTETVEQLRHHNADAVLAGLTQANPLETMRYRSWAQSFSMEMSPVPNASPELYWQDNFLRFSESSGADNQMLRASAGADACKSALSKLDRSRVRLVHIELGSDRDYLTGTYSHGEFYPPVRFAYNNPDHPKLPSEALQSPADVDKAYANEEATLRWLAEEFLPANSTVHFISATKLRRMAMPATNFNVSMSSLRSAINPMLAAWGDQPAPPKYLLVEDHYLSRAEMFQAMAGALARLDRSHKLPDSVHIGPIIGPLEVVKSQVTSGEVSASSVAHACAAFAEQLYDQTQATIPHNAIPTLITVEGINVTPAQFLRLMAEALTTTSPEAKLQVKNEQMFSGLDELFYKTRVQRDMGGLWTRKPALLEIGSVAQSAQAQK